MTYALYINFVKLLSTLVAYEVDKLLPNACLRLLVIQQRVRGTDED